MRIAYGKLGRSIPLTEEDASNVGGDIEVIRMLDRLLAAGHEVHLVGKTRELVNLPSHWEVESRTGNVCRLKNGGMLVHEWEPGGAFHGAPSPSRQHGSAFELYSHFIGRHALSLPKFDAWLIWLGQHGSSLHPVPVVQRGKTGHTNPMGSDVNYGYPLVHMTNVLGVQPLWLCPDPRNMVKFRDIWSPNQRNILAQYNCTKDNTFWDERDSRLREGHTRYVYGGIELLATSLPDRGTHSDPAPTQLFGMLVNEGYNNIGEKSRFHTISGWLKGIPKYYDEIGSKGVEIFGTWSDVSEVKMRDLGFEMLGAVPLADVDKTMRRWRATMTFPATGSGWATAKPWECFRAGTVCFAHPGYDDQGHIYNLNEMKSALGEEDGAALYTFLRPRTVSGLKERIETLKDEHYWRVATTWQLIYMQHMWKQRDGGMFIVSAAVAQMSKQQNCSHKFVDSPNCLLCDWRP